MADLNRFKEWMSRDDWDCFPEFGWDPDVIGWCNPQQGAVLNHAVSCCLEEDESYLEIGSFCGKSLVAALANNEAKAYVIDPQNLVVSDSDTESAWNQTVDAYGVRNRVTLYRTLSQYFNEYLPPIGVFYVDGDHDAGHTYECLVKFAPYLTDRAIIIVDDYNLHMDTSITGPYEQKPYPGYSKSSTPVKEDVDQWLNDTKGTDLLSVSPWHTSQAYILFER